MSAEFPLVLDWLELDSLLQAALERRNAAYERAFTGYTPPDFDAQVAKMHRWDSIGRKAANALNRAYPPLPQTQP